MNPEFRKFLQELLQDAGQTGLGEELENVLIQDLYTRLEDRLNFTAASHLNHSQLAELEKISQKKGAKLNAEIETFFKKNIPDYDKVFAQALLDFRNVYIEAVKG